MSRSYSVVIPARNAERTLGAVLDVARRTGSAADGGHRRRRRLDATAPPRSPQSLGARVVSPDGHGLRRRRAQPGLGGGHRRRGRLPRLGRDPGAGLGRGARASARGVPGRDHRLCPHVHGAARRGGGSPTSSSRRRTCRAASRDGRRSCPRSAWPSRATRRSAGTRATAARTASSAPTRSPPGSRSSSTRASTPSTTTAGRASKTSAASSGGSRTASRGWGRCSARAAQARAGPRADPLLRAPAPARDLPATRLAPGAARALRPQPAPPGRRRVDARRERCALRAAPTTAARAARPGIPVAVALRGEARRLRRRPGGRDGSASGRCRCTGPGVWGATARPGRGSSTAPTRARARRDFFDTADSYGPEVSETLVAEALHPYRRPRDRDEGRADEAGARTLGPELPARVPPVRVRGEPPSAPRRPDRSLPAAHGRPRGPDRGVGRRARGAPVGGKDQAHRSLQRRASRTSSAR